MHVNVIMNLMVSYICLYLIVSACMWKQIWNCIHVHMIWYSNSTLSVSACISAWHTVTYDLIWNSYLLVSACLMPASACIFYQLINVRCHCCCARPLLYVGSAAAARSLRGQSIRRLIAIFIWTRSAGLDSTVTAVADGKRCCSLKCLGAAGCQWFTR